MPAAYDWLVVGDAALERGEDRAAPPTLAGAAARLAAHGSSRGLRVALVAKTGDDAAGRSVRDILGRFKVHLIPERPTQGQRTTIWRDPPGRPTLRQLERGADLLLRLDELPAPSALRAGLTVVSGYSLSVEPARAAAMGALAQAERRGGSGALQLEADLLWWTNARIARRVLEPAIAAAGTVALTAADAAVLFGSRTSATQSAQQLGRLGPVVVFLSAADGGIVVLEGDRVHRLPASTGAPADRFAGPAAFLAARAQGLSVRRAAAVALEYAHSARRPGGRRARAS